MVDLLCEVVLLEQRVARVLELRQRARRAAQAGAQAALGRTRAAHVAGVARLGDGALAARGRVSPAVHHPAHVVLHRRVLRVAQLALSGRHLVGRPVRLDHRVEARRSRVQPTAVRRARRGRRLATGRSLRRHRDLSTRHRRHGSAIVHYTVCEDDL